MSNGKGRFIAFCVKAFLAVLPFALTYFFGWAVGVEAILGELGLFVIVRMLALRDIIFTVVPEGNAIIIEKFGEYNDTFFRNRNHVRLSDGKILHIRHVYRNTGTDRDPVYVKIESEGEAKTMMARKTKVWVRVDQTKREPLHTMPIKVKFTNAEDQVEEKEIIFNRDTVFVDKLFNFRQRDADLSIKQILAKIASGEYPDDFFARLDSGYFVFTGDDKLSGEKFKVQKADVIDTYLGYEYQGPKSIVAVGRGNGYLYFGSLHWVGFPGYKKVHQYHMSWVSLKADGTEDPNDEKNLTHYRLKDDIYLVTIHDAEDADNTPIIMKLQITARLVNPELAEYSPEKWLEFIINSAGPLYRQMVSAYSFKAIISVATEKGESWFKEFQKVICDPVGQDILRRYGVWVLNVAIKNVDPDDSGDAKPMRKAQAKLFIARQEGAANIETARLGAEAARKTAEGDADSKRIVAKGKADAVITEATAEVARIHQVFGEILAPGSDTEKRVSLAFLNMVSDASQKAGNWVIPFGGVENFLGMLTSNKGAMADYVKALQDAGFTPEKLRYFAQQAKRNQQRPQRQDRRPRNDERRES